MDFIQKYSTGLNDFITLSASSGDRADYVQGGGGNTSVKLDDTLMAIKASGYRLNQIEKDNGYAVLDYADIRKFYASPKPEGDIEKAGSEAAKAATQVIEGIPSLRPSVEAGFHSLLDRFVLHTHAVYANLACCSANGRQIIADTLKDKGYVYAYIPYINPGAELTFAIADAIQECVNTSGKKPEILFLENHGFIATHDNLERCIETHDQVNNLLAEAFGTHGTSFPTTAVKAEKDYFVSDTPWLKEHLKNPSSIGEESYTMKFFVDDSLYPDQMVYLSGALELLNELPESFTPTAECTIILNTGNVIYNCSEAKAPTIEETLAAIIFIYKHVRDSGNTIITMSGAGKDFISGWESEKYRKGLVK